jgi:hypothetical protein
MTSLPESGSSAAARPDVGRLSPGRGCSGGRGASCRWPGLAGRTGRSGGTAGPGGPRSGASCQRVDTRISATTPVLDAPFRLVFSVSSIKAIDITVAPVVTGLARDGSTKRVKVAPQEGALENVRRCRVRPSRRGWGPKWRWDHWPKGLSSACFKLRTDHVYASRPLSHAPSDHFSRCRQWCHFHPRCIDISRRHGSSAPAGHDVAPARSDQRRRTPFPGERGSWRTRDHNVMIDPWRDSFHGFVGGVDRFCSRISFHMRKPNGSSGVNMSGCRCCRYSM